jgi:hypothetical protein
MRWLLAPLLGFAGLLACAPVAAPPAPVPEAPPPVAVATELERPLPHPVVPPAGFREALERGTRTDTGVPGPEYWQQYASYRILANLDTEGRVLEGSAQVRYRNSSPDTLPVLVVHLHQNLHAPGAVRNEPQEITSGMSVRRLHIGGEELAEAGALGVHGPGYIVENTLLYARPTRPILPGSTTTIEVDWVLQIPQSGAGRMGWDADNLYFVAYWYPQMAVYDDVEGWHIDPYRGRAEFYMGYADYDVTLTAPDGWLVRATGELQNATEVLPPDVIARLAAGGRSDTVVHVLTPADFGAGTATLRGQGGTLDWRFTAENVRDFAFSATTRSRWDVARTPVRDHDDGQPEFARIETLWRETAPRWANVTGYSQHALRFLSELTGFPYPWPHMTAVEGAGIIDGGMEFPMMTLMGDYNLEGDEQLYAVTAHELAHMWIPMIVGSDERRYGWIDEGATNFAEAQARNDFHQVTDTDQENFGTYLQIARSALEGEIMRWTDFHYSVPAWVNATYFKPAALLATLRALIGEEAFNRGYQDFIRNWAYRHPTPWDFFNAFDAATGDELGWFWRTWYFETWTLDQAIANVTTGTGETTIEVHDLGLAPMPVRLAVTRQDGEVTRHEIPVDTWLAGSRTATLTLPPGEPVIRVEIDPERSFPDVDRSNNVWTR